MTRGKASGGAAGGRSRRVRGESSTVRFYPNDPEAPVGLESVVPIVPRENEPSFTVEGRRYAPAPYDPGTLAFQYWQGEIALARTIRVWEDLFERDFARWHDGQPLRVKLRAGKDLNAFYDRKSLQFFYDIDKKTKRYVYAAESLDIVAHEAGHAILDVYQPGFWSTPDLETASFHEAFADCSALLTTLTDSAVRHAVLAEAGPYWQKSNQVSRLAEALGRAIYDNYGPGAVSDPTRLRDARNTFRYADPTTLRAGADDSELSAEPHSFSRVFTGFFYDALVHELVRQLRAHPGEEAIEGARRLMGRLLARAIETLPPGLARYALIADRMRGIDQTEEGGVGTASIEAACSKHGIELPAFQASKHRGRKGGARGRRPDAAEVLDPRRLRSLDPDGPGGLAALRAALRLRPTSKLERRVTPLRREGSREQLLHVHHYTAKSGALGAWSGITVRVPCGCTLTRGPSGEIESLTLAPHPDPTPAEVVRIVRPWVERHAIHPRRGLRASPRELFLEKKPFRLTKEGLLERVYFD